MRRREEQGMVSALPPEQAQAAIGSTAQLNQAVKDAGDVGQQQGGFMSGLRETFRGLGSAGSGVAAVSRCI